MKSKIIYLIVIVLLPLSVEAQEIEYINIASETRYYKTIQNNIVNKNYVINSIPLKYTIEISEEEYNNESNSNQIQTSIVETTYKKMTTSIQSNGTKYRYKVNLFWKNIPKIKSYDTISISHYENVKISGSINFIQEYCTSSGCKTLTTYYENVFNQGAAATFKIPSESLTSLEQTLYFNVQKKFNDTIIIEQKAVGDYAHATSEISASKAQKFELGLTGILLDSSIESFYDEINPAVATWTESW